MQSGIFNHQFRYYQDQTIFTFLNTIRTPILRPVFLVTVLNRVHDHLCLYIRPLTSSIQPALYSDEEEIYDQERTVTLQKPIDSLAVMVQNYSS